jgi:hypothetical protein
MNTYECVSELNESFVVEQSEILNNNLGPYVPLEVPPKISNVNQISQPRHTNLIKEPEFFVHIPDVYYLKYHNLTGAKVLSCVIEGTPIEKTTWSNTIRTLYKQIADGARIIKDSILEIKTVRKVDEGFTFIKDLGISVRVKELRKNFVREIFTQAKANNLSVCMKIELTNGTGLVINITKAQ